MERTGNVNVQNSHHLGSPDGHRGRHSSSGRRRAWQEFPQVGQGKLYASLKPSGFISISGWTHERMGSPDGYLLLFDRATRTIGLKAATLGVDKNAYRVSQKKSGLNKNRTIFVRPFCREFGIAVETTVVFQNCEIDRDGVLILDLNNVNTITRGRKVKS